MAMATSKLTKYYGKVRSIVDVTLEIREGEIFGFVGPECTDSQAPLSARTTVRQIRESESAVSRPRFHPNRVGLPRGNP